MKSFKVQAQTYLNEISCNILGLTQALLLSGGDRVGMGADTWLA